MVEDLLGIAPPSVELGKSVYIFLGPVIFGGAAIFGILHFIWPFLVHSASKFDRERGSESVGQHFYILAILSIIGMFALLKWGAPVGTTDPGAIAIVTTVAIIFGYGQLVSASFSP